MKKEEIAVFVRLALGDIPNESEKEDIKISSALTIEELNAKILVNEELINENRKIIKTKEKNNHNLQKDNQKYRDQINIIRARQSSVEIAEFFINNHKGYFHIGRTDGQLEFYKHLTAKCVKCDERFELFQYNTGIGEVIVGMCPRCKLEIDFTDCRRW